jgi:hypothetical protein
LYGAFLRACLGVNKIEAGGPEEASKSKRLAKREISTKKTRERSHPAYDYS